MRDLSVPTTNTRRRLHAAATKCGWAEATPVGLFDGDQLTKGAYRLNIGYHVSGRLASACLYGPGPDGADGERGFTGRPAQIVLWIGSL
jgi:hypothetical protein